MNAALAVSFFLLGMSVGAIGMNLLAQRALRQLGARYQQLMQELLQELQRRKNL